MKTNLPPFFSLALAGAEWVLEASAVVASHCSCSAFSILLNLVEHPSKPSPMAEWALWVERHTKAPSYVFLLSSNQNPSKHESAYPKVASLSLKILQDYLGGFRFGKAEETVAYLLRLF